MMLAEIKSGNERMKMCLSISSITKCRRKREVHKKNMCGLEEIIESLHGVLHIFFIILRRVLA